MKTYLEKIGSFGGIIAAAACPVCFPKLALIGALFGLGALGAYESQLFVAAQVLIAGCHALVRPKAGDCCVFCSYGSATCPPMQAAWIM
jgi:hypothetical protein